MTRIYILLLAIMMAACGGEGSADKFEQELIDADLAFSQLSKEKGMNHAFSTYCAELGVILRPNSMPIVGNEAVTSLLLETNDSTFELTWEPLHARAALSGDLGYTYGIFTMQAKSMDLVRKGTYVSIWVKENGQWKFALDTGNDGIGE